MNPQKLKLDWNTVVNVINTGVNKALASIGFWQMSWFAQMFSVSMMMVAVVLILMGPLLVSAWRLFRNGDRPSLLGMLFIAASSVTGGVVLMLLLRLAQNVVNRHPGPIL